MAQSQEKLIFVGKYNNRGSKMQYSHKAGTATMSEASWRSESSIGCMDGTDCQFDEAVARGILIPVPEAINNEIKVTIKTVYGNILIYPACEKSEILAALTRKKTFDSRDLEMIKHLGYNIVTVPAYQLP